MTDINEEAGYYEDGEPAEAVMAAFERGNKGVTMRPDESCTSGQVVPSQYYKAYRPSLSPGQPARDQARRGQLVQA